MHVKTLCATLCIGLGLMGALTSAPADQGPTADQGVQQGTAIRLLQKIKAKVARFRPASWNPQSADKQPTGPWTDETLPGFLDSMGYDYQTVKSTRNSPIYKLTLKPDGWTIYVNVSVSEDKSKLWLSAVLSEMPEPSKIPADKMVRLLEANDKYDPIHFVIKSNRRIYLNSPIDNRNVTAKMFRSEMDELVATVRKTAPLWDVNEWNKTNTK